MYLRTQFVLALMARLPALENLPLIATIDGPPPMPSHKDVALTDLLPVWKLRELTLGHITPGLTRILLSGTR